MPSLFFILFGLMLFGYLKPRTWQTEYRSNVWHIYTRFGFVYSSMEWLDTLDKAIQYLERGKRLSEALPDWSIPIPRGGPGYWNEPSKGFEKFWWVKPRNLWGGGKVSSGRGVSLGKYKHSGRSRRNTYKYSSRKKWRIGRKRTARRKGMRGRGRGKGK